MKGREMVCVGGEGYGKQERVRVLEGETNI